MTDLDQGMPPPEEVERLLAVAARCAGLPPLRLVEPVGGGQRSLVGRVTDGHRTYVVKVATRPELGTWSRESSALGVLTGSGLVPDLLGADGDAGVLVMTDLGPPDALSDRLMAEAPGAGEAAADALGDWARLLAAVHAVHAYGAERARLFAAALAEAHPWAPPILIDGELAEAAGWWRSRVTSLGLDAGVVEAGTAALSAVPERFAVEATVLSPGDTCPDNQFLPDAAGPAGPAGRLIDFEWAEARHPAWDLACLTVPWPTCWCSWRLPDGVGDAALDGYLDATGVAAGDRERWRHDVGLATQAWAVMGAAQQWDAAMAQGPWEHPMMPPPWQRVDHRLAVAAALDADAALTALAAAGLAALRQRLTAEPLPLAPAWRDG